MINRENYLLTREFLRHVQHDLQASERSIHRYENNVNHALKWLDDKSLQGAPAMRSTFPDYLASLCANGNGSGITFATAKKIVQTARRLFIWGKMAHAENFRKVTPLWIEQLRPPRKEYMKQRPVGSSTNLSRWMKRSRLRACLRMRGIWRLSVISLWPVCCSFRECE